MSSLRVCLHTPSYNWLIPCILFPSTWRPLSIWRDLSTISGFRYTLLAHSWICDSGSSYLGVSLRTGWVCEGITMILRFGDGFRNLKVINSLRLVAIRQVGSEVLSSWFLHSLRIDF